MERLQKVIANHGYASRRKAEELILAGKVFVDGVQVTALGTKVDERAEIEVEGILLEKPELVYYLLNKPRGYISTVVDEYQRKKVTDLIAPTSINERVFPVGRLDKDATGLLILTNDGDFMQKMTHPKFHIAKTYEVTLKGVVHQSDLQKLNEGVFIEQGVKVYADEYRLIRQDKKSNSSVVQLVIHEGKYHQVKRMFSVIGFPVKKLRRIQYGSLKLEKLPVGSYRPLKKQEINRLLYLANGGK
jgi:23S rRNA pseudouridine2605 synthase